MYEFATPEVLTGMSGTASLDLATVTTVAWVKYVPAVGGVFTMSVDADPDYANATLTAVDSDAPDATVYGAATWDEPLTVVAAAGDELYIKVEDWYTSVGTILNLNWSYAERASEGLTLTSDDTTIEMSPSEILVDVGNGVDGEEITFNLYGAVVEYDLVGDVYLDEFGTVNTGVPLPELPVGSYVLEAQGVSGSASIVVSVTGAALDTTPEAIDNVEPVPPPFDPTTHWQFIDQRDPSIKWTMPHNPARWTSPLRPNWYTHDASSAPDGQVLTWQAASRAYPMEFSGYLDSQTVYDNLKFWANLRRRFWLIDHRNRAWLVTFQHFDAQARIVPNKPWAHDYTVKAVVFRRWRPGLDA